MYLLEDYVGPELETPYTSFVLAVSSEELMQQYRDEILDRDAGCVVFYASSLDSVDAFSRALLPENVTYVISDDLANGAESSHTELLAASICSRLEAAIDQGSLVHLIKIRELPSFKQAMLDAAGDNRVLIHEPRSFKPPRLVAVA